MIPVFKFSAFFAIGSVDWMKFEQDLIKNFQPYLYDVVRSNHTPVAINHNNVASTHLSMGIASNPFSGIANPSPSPNSYSGWDNLKLHYLKCIPSMALLQSRSKEGAETTILLQNTSNRYTAHVSIDTSQIPSWLIIDMDENQKVTIPPHSVRNLLVRNNHDASINE